MNTKITTTIIVVCLLGIATMFSLSYGKCDDKENIKTVDNGCLEHTYDVVEDAGDVRVIDNRKSFVSGELKYVVIDSRNLFVSVISVQNKEKIVGAFSIPSKVTYEGTTYTVTEIGPVADLGEIAFHGCRKLQSIVIPNTVTEIHGCPFDKCSSLTAINVLNPNAKLDESVFLGWGENVEITFDNAVYRGIVGNPYYLLVKAKDKTITSCKIHEKCRMIHWEAFEDCKELQSIDIPNSVESIGNRAFVGCLKLRSVTIPNSVRSIGPRAFPFCHELMFNVYENMFYLGNESNPYYALISTKNNCDPEYKIHENCEIIASGAFHYTNKATSITIPNSVKVIGDYAFCYSKTLQSITLPTSLKEINTGTFSNCPSLTSVTIPNTVTKIGSFAFYNCTSLKSIEVPNSVTSIGVWTFKGVEDVRCSAEIRECMESLTGEMRSPYR